MYLRIIIVSFLLFVLTSCSGEAAEPKQANIDDIKTIYIRNNSENVHIKSASVDELVAIYVRKDIELEQRGNEQILSVKEPWLKLGLNLNSKIEVIVPESYKGHVIIDSRSGNVEVEDFVADRLEVRTRSGNVSAYFNKLQSNLLIESKSGNVELVITDEKPDLSIMSRVGSGEQQISLPIELSEDSGDGVVQGTLGEGTYDIQVETKSGNQMIK